MPLQMMFMFAALHGDGAFAKTDLVECPGTIMYVNMHGEQSIYYGSPSRFGPLLSKSALLQGKNKQLQLRIVQPENACSPIESDSDDDDDLADMVALVERGNCTFVDKALTIQNTSAAAMVVYNTDNECLIMNYDTEHPSEVEAVHIPSFSVSSSVGYELVLAAHYNASISFQVQPPPPEASVDLSDLLLFVIATGALLWGSIWAGRDSRPPSARPDQDRSFSEATKIESLYINEWMALGFIVFAAAILIVLFFVLNEIGFYVVLFMFCVASVTSMAMVIKYPIFKLFQNQNLLAQLVSIGVSLITVVIWAFLRNKPFAWIAQNFFGVCLVVVVLRTLRLQSIKVATILLPLMLLYDVFFVFITPIFMKGESIMVRVAKGGSSDELLPMLFKVPKLEGDGIALMGYGDVVLPGLLVAFTRIYDVRENKSLLNGFFMWTYLGYCVGLGITYWGMYVQLGGSQGQPALLYLVPCTLGVVLVLGVLKGEMGKLWKGQRPQGVEEEECAEDRERVGEEILEVVEEEPEGDGEKERLLGNSV